MHGIITDGLAQLHHTIASLTPEQVAGLVSAACAAGGLLLQYLSYRRGKAER